MRYALLKPRGGTESSDMGTIIQFPDDTRLSRDGRPVSQGADATIIILPTIRIERHGDAAADGSDPADGDSRSGPRRRRSR